jgi:aminoglycoside phosphotransferase (APT) family kinase protein
MPDPAPLPGPAPLASGRDADVFALDAHRVLRRYRRGGDVGAEAAVMAYLGEQGFPVPRVYSAAGTDLVMERLDGGTMLRALVAGDIGVPDAARMLAGLLSRLHALPARRSVDAGARILHLDLHPDNVMLTCRGPVVIDWRNATEGPPDLDLATSALIVAEVGVDEGAELAGIARAFLAELLACAEGDPVRLLDRAVARRRADPARTAVEVDRLPSAAALVRAGG